MPAPLADCFSTPYGLAKCCVPGFAYPQHVRDFERVALRLCVGPARRAVVECPVRHGKSWWWSFIMPAWRALAFPKTATLIVGHGSDFAGEFLAHVRRLFLRYGRALGAEVDAQEKNTQDLLTLSNGSTVRAAGVNTGIAGRGYHWITADDVYRDQAEAESPQIRESIFRWWTAEVETRREPGCCTAVILSRRHPSDLSGQLLAMNPDLAPEDRWEQVRFQAIRDGRALWPARFPLSALERVRQDFALKGQAYLFDGLYQQDPRSSPSACEWPDHYFADDLWYDALPPDLPVRLVVTACDASKGAKSKTGDDTAIVKLVLAQDFSLWVDDCILRPMPWSEAVDEYASFVHRHRPDVASMEAAQFQESLLLHVRQQLDRMGCPIPLTPFDPGIENKAGRIRAQLSPYWAAKPRSIRVRNTAANRRGVAQAREFPTGARDDWLDSVAQGLQVINHVLYGT